MAAFYAPGDAVEVVLESSEHVGRTGVVTRRTPARVAVALVATETQPAKTATFAFASVRKTAATTSQAATSPTPATATRHSTRSNTAPAQVTDVAYLFSLPPVAYWKGDDVRQSVTHLRSAAFAEHKKDLYLGLTESEYAAFNTEIDVDHVADCQIFRNCLNIAFSDTTREVCELHKPRIVDATQRVINTARYLNATHATVNRGPKNTAVQGALAAVASGRGDADLSVHLRNSYRSSPAFANILSQATPLGQRLTRSTTLHYAEQTTQAMQRFAPQAVAAIHSKLESSGLVDGHYEAYVRSMDSMMERLGLAD